MKSKTIRTIQTVRRQIYFLTCTLMLTATTYAHAGLFDSAKKIALEASEPIGIVVIMIGGMRITTKDLYGGVAAIVGGIFIFKAQDIVGGLK